MEEKTTKKLCEEVEKAIESLIEDGLQANDVQMLNELTKIYKNVKESEMMNYGNYNGYGYGNYGNYNGRRAGYNAYGRDSYGEYNDGSYGRRGRDAKYRGDDHLDRMYNEYGRYEEGRERYGANQDTMKSLEYMLHSMEDFAKYLKEDAQSPQEVEMIRQTAQRIAQM